jgi:hypothetical protein
VDNNFNSIARFSLPVTNISLLFRVFCQLPSHYPKNDQPTNPWFAALMVLQQAGLQLNN